MIGHVYMVSSIVANVSEVLMTVVYGMSKEYVHSITMEKGLYQFLRQRLESRSISVSTQSPAPAGNGKHLYVDEE